MSFDQIFILILIQFVVVSNTLLCTTKCSFTYNLTTPFAIPETCTQKVATRKCVASIQFWYNRQQYEVSLRSDGSSTISSTDNRRFVMLQFLSSFSNYYSYSIDIACKDKYDCARDLVTNVANEMLQRQYDYSGIMNELQPLIVDPSSSSLDNTDLYCYDSYQNENRCGTSTNPGSCVITNEVSKKKVLFQCDTKLAVGNAFISIYHGDNDFIQFEVHCNRSLCNTQSTLQQAKDIMYKYNVTVTPDGRLSGSRFIVSISLFVLSSNALKCTTNCSFTYNLTTPFTIPDECNQKVTAGQCIGSIQFWFNRQQYVVSFHTDPSNKVSSIDNRRSVLLQFSSTILTFFSYNIRRTCKNRDDCARDLITDVANEILQREYDYSTIMDEIRPLVADDSLITSDTALNCYLSKQNDYRCGSLGDPGSCVIASDVSKKKLSFECDTDMTVGNAYISIYHSDSNYVSFDVHCNRSLCNTESTLQQAKEIMYKHNITVTPDGRLNGSRFIVSISLMIMTILFSFFNQL